MRVEISKSKDKYLEEIFKYLKSYFNLPKEEWKIFKNTHKPIIDEYTWNIAQQLRNNRKKPTRSGKKSIFYGLLF